MMEGMRKERKKKQERQKEGENAVKGSCRRGREGGGFRRQHRPSLFYGGQPMLLVLPHPTRSLVAHSTCL
jgi:hypothetical protein